MKKDHDNPLDSNDSNDPLWKLMGKVREPKPSPFFASKVLRAIREEENASSKPIGLIAWLRARWFVPVGCSVAAAMAIWFSVKPAQPDPTIAPIDPVESMAVAVVENVDTDDYNVIADLDELIAYEDTSIWLEDSPSNY